MPKSRVINLQALYEFTDLSAAPGEESPASGENRESKKELVLLEILPGVGLENPKGQQGLHACLCRKRASQ